MDQSVNRPRLNGEDTCHIECGFTIDNDDMDVLSQCYLPLITSNGLSVYLLLASLSKTMVKPYNHLHLCTLTGLDIGNLSVSLMTLEQYGLVKTMVKPIDLHYDYIYALVQPLSASAFLKNPIYSRQLANTVSMDDYTAIIKRFASLSYDRSGYNDVTTPYDGSTIIQSWSDHSESRYQKANSSAVIEDSDGFDMSAFLKGLDDFRFPHSLRTDENLRAIAQLAKVFGLSEIEMQSGLWRAIEDDGNRFSLNALMHYCATHAKKKDSGVSREDLPPAAYLQSLKQGVALADFETRALTALVEKYHFSNAINNVIIEKVIATNKRISKSALDAYASYLVYSHVDTPQAAKEALAHYGAVSKTNGSYRYVESKPDYDSGRIVDEKAASISDDDLLNALKEVK